MARLVGIGAAFFLAIFLLAAWQSHTFPALDTSNAWTGSNDFSAATLLKARVGASCTTTANGDFCYDATNLNWHFWDNGADSINVVAPASVTVTNGDCGAWTRSGNTIALSDAGGPCATTNSAQTFTNKALTSPALTTPTIGGTAITNVPVSTFSGFIGVTTVVANINKVNFPFPSTVRSINGVCQTTSVSCSTYPAVRITDGTNSQTCAWSNNSDPNCTGLSQSLNAGFITMSISTVASGCTATPSSCNLTVGLTF